MKEFTALEYIKIDVASNYGLDKETWETRLDWFAKHEEDLDKLISSAEEPALYFAGVQAYKDALEAIPSGYPVSFDATTSGLQILACLIGCKLSALRCNLIDTGSREDAYTSLYKDLCLLTGGNAKIERKDLKRAIMTSLYGSTKVPIQVFGEGELLAAFYQIMEEKIPGAWELNKALKELWNPYALSHDWVMSDNFHVHVKVMGKEDHFVQFLDEPVEVTTSVNVGSKEGLSLPANITHSVDGYVVREITRRCDFSKEQITYIISLLNMKGKSDTRKKDKMVIKLWGHYKNSGMLSARIFDYLDEKNMGLVNSVVIGILIQSMPNKPFQVISIHDCFRVLPAYGNDIRKQYIQIMSEIAGSNLLSFIASQIKGKILTVTKMGDISKDILNSEYALS
ncbi:MAG: hypothetical protein COA63_013920 [Methylophaga sp.]|nr:hypothetical protein [Methylophaga sp.]